MHRGRFDELEIFVRVVERGSLTAAAAALALPLATVSRKLKSLETRLGVQLVHRNTRRLAVSEAGRTLYEACAQAFSIIEAAETGIGYSSLEPTGTLRVLAPYAFGIVGLEPRLAEFRRRYPNIRLSLILNNQPLDLIEHGFDVAIRPAPVPDSTYRMRSLSRLTARLVASPAYLDRAGRPRTPAEVSQHALLSNQADMGPVRWSLRGPSGAAEVAGTPTFTANDPTILRQQAISGTGIALISEFLINRDIAEGILEPVLPGWSGQEDIQYVILFPHRTTIDRKIRAFVDFVVEVLGPGGA
jgi:DNA-binding transcriptional LysR family regulator